ncbi:helix-turn-helix domain-containing protein [Nocardioides sp. AN3]
MATGGETLMSALGLGRPSGRLYERLVHKSGQTLAELAEDFEMPVATLLTRLQPLVDYGVVTIVGDRVDVMGPAETVSRAITETAGSAARAHQRLQDIAAALPFLAGAGVRGQERAAAEAEPLDGELILDNLGPDELRGLIRQTAGEILLLRPDQWALPYEDQLAEPIAEAVAAGRRCRAIYPVRVLSEAPAVVRHRLQIGEHVRLHPELPTRMIVLEGTHVIVPEPLGLASSPRVMVRQRGLVELATLYFDHVWSRSAPLDEPAAPSESRRFLLEQLASGAQDEQIARRLGLSLRTVRRRVADLMTELEATSRFQAGVEAARRGWL